MIVSSNRCKQKCISFLTEHCASAEHVQNIRILQKCGQAEFRISLTLRHFRGEVFPKAHNTGTAPRSPSNEGERTRGSAAELRGPHHFHVNVQEKATEKFVWEFHRVFHIMPDNALEDGGHPRTTR